jgi:hypothetical protein
MGEFLPDLNVENLSFTFPDSCVLGKPIKKTLKRVQESKTTGNISLAKIKVKEEVF